MENQKVNLATTTNITTTYAGEAVLPFISQALFQGVTLQNNWVNIHTNYKDRAVLQKLDFTDGLITVDSCDFTPTGTMTKGQTVITLVDAMINLQFCYTPWERDWQGLYMTAGANNTAFPADLSSYIASQVAKEASKQIEHMIWKSGWSGTSATTTYSLAGLSGFVKLLNDDSNTVKVAATTLTATNILGEMNKEYAAAYEQTLDQQIMVISPKTAKLLRIAVSTGATGSNSMNMLNPVEMNFLGTPIKIANGFPNDTIVMYVPGNNPNGDLHFATDLLNDITEVTMIDQRPISGAKNVNVVMRFKLGTGVPYPAQTTLYIK